MATEANLSADQIYLDAVDWVLPRVAEHGWLWESLRKYVRRLFADMREAAVLAREDVTDPKLVRASLLCEGVAYGLLEDYASAAECFIRCREISKADPLLELNVGALLVTTGHRDRARAAFETAASLAPKLPASWASLAVLNLLDGNWRETRRAAEQALLLDPPRPDVMRLCLINADAAEGMAFNPDHLGSGDATPPQIPKLPKGRSSGGDRPRVFTVLPAEDLPRLSALIGSLRASGEPADLHVHLVNPGDETAQALSDLRGDHAWPRLTWSSENLVAPSRRDLRRRLRTLRFSRARGFISRGRAPFLIVEPHVVIGADLLSSALPTPQAPIGLLGRTVWERGVTISNLTAAQIS